MPSFDKTVEFYLNDFARTLFPLDTNRVLISAFAADVGQYIYEEITHENDGSASFLPQTRVYAAKLHHHLRRTVKLDPVAEFFLYDLTYRNRSAFAKSQNDKRVHFGYRFAGGQPVSPVRIYRQFRSAVRRGLSEFNYCAKFDISCYFNCIYHHDLVGWFNDVAKTEADAIFFDKFLKQTNSGRSLDCLVHGLYPAKMIGSHFLSFIEQASWLKSALTLRFMDDVYLFSSSYGDVLSDFIEIQRMLGERGLSVNPAKTKLGEVPDFDVPRELDAVKARLLKRRGNLITGSGGDVHEHVSEDVTLDAEEGEYLMALLKSEELEEDDAELILTLMRDFSEDVASYLPDFFERFPNLAKNIFYFCDHVADKAALASQVSDFLAKAPQITEYQLFWLGKILETHLLAERRAGDILSELYGHKNATDVSRAKVLEIPDRRYGLGDLRSEHLKAGSSGWLAWASAVGVRAEKRRNRNHLLSYFANGSPTNELISNCVQRLPESSGSHLRATLAAS